MDALVILPKFPKSYKKFANMTNWLTLDSDAALHALKEQSVQQSCLIFKHSTRCSISTTVKARLERGWQFSDEQLPAYYLDLLQHRSVSNEVASLFDVTHESPQVLLIANGECIYAESHHAITVAEIAEQLAHYAATAPTH